jgi:hypothetical protein
MTNSHSKTATVNCPSCGALLRYTPKSVGIKVGCPKCKCELTLPPAPPAPPPLPAEGTKVAVLEANQWKVEAYTGEEFGPYTLDQLRSFIQQNRVVPETRLRNLAETNGQWIRADQISCIACFFRSSPASNFPPTSQTVNSGTTSFGGDAASRSSLSQSGDTWGITGSVAGGISGGLLLVAIFFTPFACCAVPISTGGMIAALFSKNPKLKAIGLIGNAVVLFLSLIFAIWVSWKLREAISNFDSRRSY